MMHRSGITALILSVALTACVTTPEDTYSTADLALLQERGWEPNFDGITPANLEAHVRAEIATPIVFHGLVLDESSNPIPDHPVSIVVFDRVLSPFQSPFFGWTTLQGIRTDRDGRFSLTDLRGAAVVVSVGDRDYWDIDEGRAQRVYHYSTWRLAENEHMLPVDPQSPAVFHLDRKPERARTTLVRLGSITLPLDAQTGIALNRPRYPVEPGVADLLLHFTREPANVDGRFSWRLRITTPDGGIQRVQTLFTDQAPAEGYLQQLDIGYEASAQGWNHRVDIPCFVLTGEGHYASLVLRVRTLETPFVAVSGKLNPHGERYLD